MQRIISVALAAVVGAAVVPTSLATQFILRDDVDGWGWLEIVPDRDAVVQLVRASPATGASERLDAELLAELRRIGVRRVWEIGHFDATESSVMGECSVVD